ncbi:hypothetical protein TNIN_297171 [Trichonephila inaurata madagascariensis]|uniref:Uncharacterized protein n=1 Tax=Trichonephila inaurata madagascariensis TaxID=2747483 RepID=A0A8X6WVF7_9ARAC|nr:hypothetical protein TNIN_297171 [Trichonephila inaurata madagascariensis]
MELGFTVNSWRIVEDRRPAQTRQMGTEWYLASEMGEEKNRGNEEATGNPGSRPPTVVFLFHGKLKNESQQNFYCLGEGRELNRPMRTQEARRKHLVVKQRVSVIHGKNNIGILADASLELQENQGASLRLKMRFSHNQDT